MSKHNLQQLIAQGQRFLFLQGPVGPFFRNFATWLTQNYQKICFKVNLNAGDAYFYPADGEKSFNYYESLATWKEYLATLIKQLQIDTIIIFGDCRVYHQQAKEVAQQLGLTFWVFEEGYYRPYYTTLEKGGVNANSELPLDITFYQKQQQIIPSKPKPISTGFLAPAFLATLYYLAMSWGSKKFTYYQHHRETKLSYYLKGWLRSFYRKYWYRKKEKAIATAIANKELTNYFLLALQVNSDSQIQTHSNFKSIAEVIMTVGTNFAKYAPTNCSLVIKHHPMERGFTNYQLQIEQLLKANPQLQGRIFYVHDLDLPTLLRNTQGVITVNSTIGISALIHHLPVKTLGTCAYDMPGLTFQGALERFWLDYKKPEHELELAYRNYHLTTTQLNGSFYKYLVLYPNTENQYSFD